MSRHGYNTISCSPSYEVDFLAHTPLGRPCTRGRVAVDFLVVGCIQFRSVILFFEPFAKSGTSWSLEFEFYSFSVATSPPRDSLFLRLTFYVEVCWQYSSRHVLPLIVGLSIDRARRRLQMEERIDAGLSGERSVFGFSSNVRCRRRMYRTRRIPGSSRVLTLGMSGCVKRSYQRSMSFLPYQVLPCFAGSAYTGVELFTFDNLAASFMSTCGNSDTSS